MRHAFVGLAIALVGFAARPTHAQNIVPPSAKPVLLADVGQRTEGPAPAADGSVYFVDIDVANGGHIFRWDPATQKAVSVRAPSGLAAGLAFGPDGQLATAELARNGGRRVGSFDVTSGKYRTLADSVNGKPIHGANDLVFDEAGRLYFTEYPFMGPNDVLYRAASGVYRIDRNGGVTRIISDAGTPNGIAVSPDQRTLYVSTNKLDIFATHAILAYDLAADGQAKFRTVLVRLPSTQQPDGMAIDVEGNLYVAMYAGRTGVAIYDSTGKEIAYVDMPAAVTNVKFGRGRASDVLYITSANALYMLRVNRQGYAPTWLR
jgi:gluconolactonase